MSHDPEASRVARDRYIRSIITRRLTLGGKTGTATTDAASLPFTKLSTRKRKIEDDNDDQRRSTKISKPDHPSHTADASSSHDPLPSGPPDDREPRSLESYNFCHPDPEDSSQGLHGTSDLAFRIEDQR